MGQVKTPNVENLVIQNNFKLRVLAYRKLSTQELQCATKEYMRNKKIRSLPVSGEDTIVTIIGHDGC